MTRLGRMLKWAVALVLAAVIAAGVWLYVAPPALIRVGSGYSAKIVCSNVFLANRDPGEVLALDVQAPGHPLLRLMRANVDRGAGTVKAGLFGLFGKGLALYREGTGCATVADGDLEAARGLEGAVAQAEGPARSDAPWPQGNAVDAPDVAIAGILDSPALSGPGMRAIVVVHRGRIIGERYGDGFSAQTPLLGWSMTKTVTAAIIGTLIKEGRLSRDGKGLFPQWENDERRGISLADMLAMSSGLAFNEDYGDVTDVTRMLYLEPDMAAFAADKPLAGEIGRTFSYSSGTTVMLSRIWQNAVGDEAEALAWPRKALFEPLGMHSAILETDARGTFGGSSYLYATARDWARFGQFLLQDGEWNGRRILPEGYVDWMRTPYPASDGEYGRHVWLHGPRVTTPANQPADAGFDLPEDAYWMIGHDGQTITVIPSQDLVVVRLGLSPTKLAYKPQALVEAVSKAVAASGASARQMRAAE